MSDDEDFDIDFDDEDVGEDEDAIADEEEEHIEEEQELIAERKAFERVGISMASTAKTPKENFRMVVSSIFYKLQTQLRFTDNDLTNILEPIDKIQKIQYKNHNAYILGYFVSQGGRDNLKLTNPRTIIQRLEIAESALEDPSITRADIIRYSVFWNEIKK